MLLRVLRNPPLSKTRICASLIALSGVVLSGVGMSLARADDGDKTKSGVPAVEIKLGSSEKEAPSSELNDELAGLLELDSEKKEKSKTQPSPKKSSGSKKEQEEARKDDESAEQPKKTALGKPDISGFVLIELSQPKKKQPEASKAAETVPKVARQAGPTSDLPAAVKKEQLGGGTGPGNPKLPLQDQLAVPSLSTPALRALAVPGERAANKTSLPDATNSASDPQTDGTEQNKANEPAGELNKRKLAEQSEESQVPSKEGEPARLPSDPKSLLTGSSRDGSSKNETCPGDPANASPDSKQLASQPDDLPLEETDNDKNIDKPIAQQSERTHSVTLSDKGDSAAVTFSERELAIERKIIDCLNYFRANPENTTRRGPWALMHATLPFGVETEIIAGNRKVNAIGWMCYNGVCAKQRVFQPTRRGFRLHVGPGVQGHEGQFLAVLAQSQVSPDYPIQIGRSRYTVADLVKYEMATCREKSELTFKLIGLSHYLNPNQRWKDQRGRVWNLEKMVAEELAQPINGAACGGTHRLMGLSFALIKRQEAGLPLNGHWSRAEKFVNEFVNYTMTLQNPDGSFSTEWFEGRGFANDTKRKVQTTGHIAEWLIYTLPDEYLRSPQILAAMEYLLASVGENPSYDWPIGPRGHALRAMALYKQRVFDAQPKAVAVKESSRRR